MADIQKKKVDKGDGNGKSITANIVQEPMVNWFEPAQLVRTGIYSVLGALFGAFADRREMQAALQKGGFEEDERLGDYSGIGDELWLDYVADLGDGWDATYSVAWLLARPTLNIDGHHTQRGELLLLGGDQVYPTPTRETYQNRFVGPYRGALPYCENNPPRMFAIPGNHDWYDGLTSFLRLFCQGRWIGGWATQQRRSYFALCLPQHWWLWAVDVQLAADLDAPQKKYFQHFAAQLQAGDKVILCIAEPSWVLDSLKHSASDTGEVAVRFTSLDYLQQLINVQQAEVSVTLAGDLHHYSHYQQSQGEECKITCGGGGAYLLGTQHLPESLELNTAEGRVKYERRAAYPDAAKSRLLILWNAAFCAFNPTFSIFIASIYLFYTWIWQSASKVPGGADSLMQQLSLLPLSIVTLFSDVVPMVWVSIAHRPGTAIVTALVPLGMLFFADKPPGKFANIKRTVWGGLHGAAHLLLGIALFWIFARLNLYTFLPEGKEVVVWMDSFPQMALFSMEVLISGFILGGSLMGLYLVLSNIISGLHGEFIFSALHIPHHKNFLRLHIRKDGMTIYPVAVDAVCRDWETHPDVEVLKTRKRGGRRFYTLRVDERMGSSWFAPRGGNIPVRLINGQPIKFSPARSNHE